MRTQLLTIILLTGLICCVTRSKDEPKEIALKDLELNEIVHDSLTNQQLKDIARIQEVFAEVNSSSLEETIDNFRRDEHPDKEISIWLKMADAYELFTLDKREVVSLDKKKEAYELLLLRSMMSEGEVMNKYKATSLTDKEVKEIFTYYLEKPKPLTIKKK